MVSPMQRSERRRGARDSKLLKKRQKKIRAKQKVTIKK